jgi:hypothetical protein
VIQNSRSAAGERWTGCTLQRQIGARESRRLLNVQRSDAAHIDETALRDEVVGAIENHTIFVEKRLRGRVVFLDRSNGLPPASMPERAERGPLQFRFEVGHRRAAKLLQLARVVTDLMDVAEQRVKGGSPEREFFSRRLGQAGREVGE